jgi:serine phosphatase RsbU (regulator of sigma subunit)
MNNFLDFIQYIKKSILLLLSKEKEDQPYENEFKIRIDRLFAFFLFLSHFSFYTALIFIPGASIPSLIIILIAISIINSSLLFFSQKDKLLPMSIVVASTLTNVLVFAGVILIVHHSDPSLDIQFLNNFYIPFAFLIIIHCFRLKKFGCIYPGVILIFLHLISLAILNTFYEKELSLGSLLPDAIYFMAILVGTGIILVRREDIRQIHDLNRERTEMNQELELAKKIQDTLFPIDMKIRGLNYEVFRQSHNFIGGDFYDFIQLREGNVGIFLTDIAGHGISSSMVASIMKVLVSTIPYRMKLEPVKLLSYLDVHLARDLDHHHASAVYMFVNFQERLMTLGNAGHPYIIYCPKGGEFVELETEGSILGFHIREPIVDEVKINFNIGDRFFLYTDGLVESPTENGNTLNEKDLLSLLNRRKDLRDLKEMKEFLLKTISEEYHLKRFTDDTMFLLFEITER